MLISPTVYSNPAITSMNGKRQPIREKNTIPLLSKPALVCMCPIKHDLPGDVAPKHKPTSAVRALSPLSCKPLCTVWAHIWLLCVPWVLAAVTVAVWKRFGRWVFRKMRFLTRMDAKGTLA